jgi:hypothetical protein
MFSISMFSIIAANQKLKPALDWADSSVQCLPMRRLLIVAILLCSLGTHAQDWGPLQFLIGHWNGEGGTADHGSGVGAFSFTPDLRGKVLLRKNFAEYPEANGKPAYRHEDLMILYHDGISDELRAIYFDSEEHLIHYVVKPSGNGVVFLSEGPQDAARFRLTYTRADPDKVKLKFEIAAPGKDFATYIEASAHRDKSEK